MSCVARKESTPGTSTPGTIEKGARVPPSLSPSAAANFMGWYFAICTPELSPLSITASVPLMPTIAATRMLAKAKRMWRCLMRYQQLIPMAKMAPVIHPLKTEWKNFEIATGLSTRAQKSTISWRTVSGLNAMPTGCCIHELATNIHTAEIAAPMPVSHVQKRWVRRLTLSHPKNITAKNVASMKKAKMPSMASGAPKMSPTNHE